MALSAKLKIDGGRSEGYNVLECEYEFSQLDEPMTMKPISDVKGGKINFTMLSLDKKDEDFFYSWMFDKSEVKDGEFTFPIWIREGKDNVIVASEKKMKFEKAFCLFLNEKYSNLYMDDGETPSGMVMRITLSATTIKFSDKTFTNSEIDKKR